jgi:hypothetical protein
MNRLIGFFTLLALGAGGCVGMPMAPVHVSQLQVSPPSLIVAKRAPAPLYIVLDPSHVPDEYVIPQDELKEIRISELQTFVRRDLKRAMETYFEKVEVVAPGYAFPAPPYWKADVRIDSLRSKVIKATDNQSGAVAAQIFGEITWAFAIGPTGSSDYLFSYAGHSVGNYSMTHVSESGKMFASAFETALGDLLQAFTEKKVPEKLIPEEPRAEAQAARGDDPPAPPPKPRRKRPKQPAQSN